MKWNIDSKKKMSSLSFEDELVQRVLRLERDLKEAFPERASTIASMPVEKIKAWLLPMLERTDSYKQANLFFKLDTGYHSTGSENLESIQAHGLLTRAERTAKNITTKNHGQSLGDGIYTVNTPYWDNYGDTVLLVLRLRGKQTWVPTWVPFAEDECRDTVVDKGCFLEVVVLRSSCQCMPLISFSASLPKEERRRFLRTMRRGMAGIGELFQAELAHRLLQHRKAQKALQDCSESETDE